MNLELFKFALNPAEPAITPQSELWSQPLPASRHAFTPSQEKSDSKTAVTFGDYFTAAYQFLAHDNLSPTCEALSKLTGKTVAAEDVDGISIYLVKHGAFYHPAKVIVHACDQRFSLALNMAVSSKGQKIIAQEIQSLSRLNTELKTPFWPPVLGFGQGEDLNGRLLPMFLAPWLEGYCEFHLTGENPEQRRVIVWDPDKDHFFLTPDQIDECLFQAACILTYAYNPMTFEAIGDWHHAAGDFVIAATDNKIDLRLITVRNYAPIIDNPEPDVELILDALLVFLVQISLKLRLDRLDGTGRMACHPDTVVHAICRGFFRGLRMMTPLRGLPEDFDSTIKAYIAIHDVEKLKEIAVAVSQKTAFSMKERHLLQSIMTSHAAALIDSLQT